MIHREATIKYKGYDPDDLKPNSNKRICCVCDICGRVRYLSKCDYRDLCHKCANKTEEHRKKISDSRKKEQKWQNDNNPKWKDGKTILMITLICEQCGNEYTVTHKKAENSRFCSLKCVGEWQSKVRIGENSSNWKGGGITLICEQCGNEYTVKKARSEISKFCSKKCQGEWKSKNQSGKNSPNWKQITLICEWCGKNFMVPECEKNSQFCSQKCFGKWLSKNNCGENNPNWQGGISFDPYCEKFNKVKKKEVRDKYDNCDYLTGIHRNICNIVGGNIEELSVHHFDYNKQQGCNDIPWKLVPVSKSHNTMFNFNQPFWQRLIGYALEYDQNYYENKGVNIWQLV